MRVWLLTRFRKAHLREAFRRCICGACGGFTRWLPTAPGWFDEQHCERCNIVWDNALGSIRGREVEFPAQPVNDRCRDGSDSLGPATACVEHLHNNPISDEGQHDHA